MYVDMYKLCVDSRYKIRNRKEQSMETLRQKEVATYIKNSTKNVKRWQISGKITIPFKKELNICRFT